MGYKHGQFGTPTYESWRGMINRCVRPSTERDAKNYRDRGITVCDAWLQSFSAFLADMGERPAGTQIDRIDNNQGYGPSNCRWATLSEQSRNRRNVVNIEYLGRTQCVSAWAKEFGLTRSRIGTRLRAGWPVDLALTTPGQGPKKPRAAA